MKVEKKELSAKEKLQQEIEKDKNERLQKFINEHNKLCKELKCSFVPQITIQGDRVISTLVAVAI